MKLGSLTKIRFVAMGGRDWGGRRIEWSNQKIQTSSVKLITTRDVMCDMINIINTAVCYMWKLREEILWVFIARKNIFSLPFVFTCDDGCSLRLLW